jgi:hypothetical protein
MQISDLKAQYLPVRDEKLTIYNLQSAIINDMYSIPLVLLG